MTIPVYAFVGRSGCGKTTLLSALIPLFHARNLKVGVIKHTHYARLETDVPGTDTRRLWDAGADSVVLVGRDRVMETRRHDVEPALDEVLQGLDSDLDLLILEGAKRCPYPKLEVVRQARDAEPISGLENRIAFISDVTGIGEQENLPCFALDAYSDIVAFIIGHTRKNNGGDGWDGL